MGRSDGQDVRVEETADSAEAGEASGGLEEQAPPELPEEQHSYGTYMAEGMCLGLAVGIAFGPNIFGNMGVGIAVGMCLGMALGAAIKRPKK